MNLPDILNVAIGLVVVYFLLSSLASLLLEMREVSPLGGLLSPEERHQVLEER